jgi:hypothetical protein
MITNVSEKLGARRAVDGRDAHEGNGDTCGLGNGCGDIFKDNQENAARKRAGEEGVALVGFLYPF